MVPTKKPTPAEYTVLVWFLSLLFIVLGVVGIFVAIRAPTEKHVMAVLLAKRGAICIGIGLAIQFVYWLYRRFVD